MAMKAASRWLQGLAAIEETALTLAGCLLRAGCLMLLAIIKSIRLFNDISHHKNYQVV